MATLPVHRQCTASIPPVPATRMQGRWSGLQAASPAQMVGQPRLTVSFQNSCVGISTQAPAACFPFTEGTSGAMVSMHASCHCPHIDVNAQLILLTAWITLSPSVSCIPARSWAARADLVFERSAGVQLHPREACLSDTPARRHQAWIHAASGTDPRVSALTCSRRLCLEDRV